MGPKMQNLCSNVRKLSSADAFAPTYEDEEQIRRIQQRKYERKTRLALSSGRKLESLGLAWRRWNE
jgi:hypothetical protein